MIKVKDVVVGFFIVDICLKNSNVPLIILTNKSERNLIYCSSTNTLLILVKSERNLSLKT